MRGGCAALIGAQYAAGGRSINMKRKFSVLAAAVLLSLPGPASACEPQPREHLLSISDTVVVGRAAVSIDKVSRGGKLRVSNRIKGSKLSIIPITLETTDRNPDCPNSWIPRKAGTYIGTFYVRRLPKGRFGVIKFVPEYQDDDVQ
jgi:hypothetical protein